MILWCPLAEKPEFTKNLQNSFSKKQKKLSGLTMQTKIITLQSIGMAYNLAVESRS